jgi:hypothetical protein
MSLFAQNEVTERDVDHGSGMTIQYVLEDAEVAELMQLAKGTAEAAKEAISTINNAKEEELAAANEARAGAKEARDEAGRARTATEESKTATGKANVAATKANDAEVLRVKAEAERVESETQRNTAESGRVDAEKLRVTAETGQANAEGKRAIAETGRVDAEKARVTAELGRVDAEGKRKTEEGKRATAESDRVKAENKRTTNTGQRLEDVDAAIKRMTELSDHPEYTGEDHYVYRWNEETKAYENTGIYNKGQDLDFSTMTDEEKAGIKGMSAYEVAVEDGFVGNVGEWRASLEGKNTYQLWLDAGNEGSFEDFLEEQKGKDGAAGKDFETPTLDVAPTEDTLTYGPTAVQFRIGQQARVWDAEKGDAGEYVFWQLFDIVEGKALWKLSGSGEEADKYEVNEIRKFTLPFDFVNSKYLPCDGSEIDPSDYPDLKLVTTFKNTSIPVPFPSGGNNNTFRRYFYSKHKIVALVNSTVYVSDNDGQTWPISADLPTAWTFAVRDIQISGDNIIIAGQENGYASIYVSIDNGVSWVSTYRDTVASDIWAITTGDNGRVIAWRNRVYYSTDNGISWAKSSLVGLITDAIYSKGRVIVAQAGKVFYSDNNGYSFIESTGQNGAVGTYILPFDADTLISVNVTNLSKSTDNGASWIFVSQTRTPGVDSLSNLYPIDSRPAVIGRSILCAATKPVSSNGMSITAALLISKDAGLKWTIIPSQFAVVKGTGFGHFFAGDGHYGSTNVYTEAGVGVPCIWSSYVLKTRRDGNTMIMSGGSIAAPYGGDLYTIPSPIGLLPEISDGVTHSYIKALK